MKKIRNLFIVLILAISMVTPVSTAPLIGSVNTVSAAVKISHEKISLKKGQTKQLKIKGTSKKATWKSSNTKVAAVSTKGKVTAKKAGNATITAKVGKKKYTCKVTVKVAAKKSTAKTTNREQKKTNEVWLSATGSKYHKIPNCGRMNPNNARKVKLSENSKRQ